MDSKKAVVISISGCSSSGKTTLARLLRDIFPKTFILHEDDFYKPEAELPIKEGLVDWDCAEAISFPDLEAALKHIHETGTFPVSPDDSVDATTTSTTPTATTTSDSPTASSPYSSNRLSHRSDHGCCYERPCRCPPTSQSLPSPPSPPSSSSSSSPSSSSPSPRSARTSQTFIASKEDQNSVGACPVPEAVVARLKTRVEGWASSPAGREIFGRLSLCVLDGFLLYTPEAEGVMAALDIKLFLLVSRARATARREARDGYVTLEGFWKDPPGYVDKIVWPNYAESHAWLFEGGDVEGRLREDVLERQGIRAQTGRGLDVDMSTTLEWAVETVIAELERMAGAGSE